MSSYESAAQPIKLGYLMDFVLPEEYPEENRLDLTQSLELIFERGFRDGVIDRPVEIVYREVEGLPKGSAKAVIDAYGELVDEGCLAIFGPFITDNAEPTRVEIERRGAEVVEQLRVRGLAEDRRRLERQVVVDELT